MGWYWIAADWQRTITDRHRLTKDNPWPQRTDKGRCLIFTDQPYRMIPDRHGPTKDDAWSSRTGVHHRSCAYCSLCLLCVVCCVSATLHIVSIHAHNVIHLMMIIHGIQHGGLYFRWCSLLPKKARKMRRRRARSPFSLLNPPQNQWKSLDWKMSIFIQGAFFLCYIDLTVDVTNKLTCI